MARLQVKLKSSNCAGSQAPSIIVIQNQTEARHFGRDAEIVSVHPPCLYPGSEAILAAISADETSALPGGSERLPEIQAMDGNKSVMQMLKSGNMPTRSFMFAVAGKSVVAPSLPSLDAGFRHPCRNDGSSTLVLR